MVAGLIIYYDDNGRSKKAKLQNVPCNMTLNRSHTATSLSNNVTAVQTSARNNTAASVAVSATVIALLLLFLLL